MLAQADTLNESCRHMCMCAPCADTLAKGDQKKCPICRTALGQIISVFVSGTR
jgi:hypothetical protein